MHGVSTVLCNLLTASVPAEPCVIETTVNENENATQAVGHALHMKIIAASPALPVHSQRVTMPDRTGLVGQQTGLGRPGPVQPLNP
jgi:hypothetical protein